MTAEHLITMKKLMWIKATKIGTLTTEEARIVNRTKSSIRTALEDPYRAAQLIYSKINQREKGMKTSFYHLLTV